MRVIRRDILGLRRDDEIVIVPLFDIHLGAAACDEARLESVVKKIATGKNYYWIGGGDYADWINRKDKRYDTMSVAEWCRGETDIVGAQLSRFKKIIKPIALKCLALVRGNHEESILRHYERDIYAEIVTWVKELQRLTDDQSIGAGVYGWLLLGVYRCKTKPSTGGKVKINLHHGFANGRLAGGKALAMQRWLWTHECDLALHGHAHNSEMQMEKVEGISDQGVPWEKKRFGVFCGSFLNSSADNDGTYCEAKGYLPQGNAYWECRIRPAGDDSVRRIEVAAV